jgi:hypothetical protein
MIKPTLQELLTSNKSRKILFLGREGLFTVQEIERFLKRYSITMTKTLEEDVVAVVEHHSLNPVEEDLSCVAYAQNIPLYKLVDFEKLLSESIDDNQVLMALKLGNDQERIYRLICNDHLSDTLFVKLLGMYEWHEDEEDNNKDREVIMATLRRYIEVKPNEQDLLYSSLTLKRLAREATDPKLLYALIGFPNMTFLQKGKQKITLRESIAINKNIDEDVITRLISLRDPGVDIYLACNESLSLPLLQKFATKNVESIDEALASNKNIDDALFESLLQKSDDVVKVMLWYQPVNADRLALLRNRVKDEKLFASLGENREIEEGVLGELIESSNILLLESLAKNDRVSLELLDRLYKRAIPSTYDKLALNPNSSIELLTSLYESSKDNIDIVKALASNPSTPEYILRELYQRDIFEINESLASNSSTPLELLNIFKIDTRLRNALTGNERFVASITQSLGL